MFFKERKKNKGLKEEEFLLTSYFLMWVDLNVVAE